MIPVRLDSLTQYLVQVRFLLEVQNVKQGQGEGLPPHLDRGRPHDSTRVGCSDQISATGLVTESLLATGSLLSCD